MKQNTRGQYPPRPDFTTMSTSLVPVAPAKLAPAARDLSPAILIRSIQPDRVISDVGNDCRSIWYFEQKKVGRNRTCAYICHARGASTFTMAYHPLDRNDQVVADLPMEKLPAAIDDLLAAGFGKRQDWSGAGFSPARTKTQIESTSARPGLEQGEHLSLM